MHHSTLSRATRISALAIIFTLLTACSNNSITANIVTPQSSPTATTVASTPTPTSATQCSSVPGFAGAIGAMAGPGFSDVPFPARFDADERREERPVQADGVRRARRGENRAAPARGEGQGAARMVVVLVGEKQCLYCARLDAARGQPPLDLPRREAGIDQNSCGARFDQAGVSARA